MTHVFLAANGVMYQTNDDRVLQSEIYRTRRRASHEPADDDLCDECKAEARAASFRSSAPRRDISTVPPPPDLTAAIRTQRANAGPAGAKKQLTTTRPSNVPTPPNLQEAIKAARRK